MSDEGIDRIWFDDICTGLSIDELEKGSLVRDIFYDCLGIVLSVDKSQYPKVVIHWTGTCSEYCEKEIQSHMFSYIELVSES
tara:strand:- start:468 stop:713 length:246 start_codon:yes stop_codon:yes gene_type:complete